MIEISLVAHKISLYRYKQIHTEKQAMTSLLTFTDGGGQQIQNSIYLTLHTLIDVHILSYLLLWFFFCQSKLEPQRITSQWHLGVCEREIQRERQRGGLFKLTELKSLSFLTIEMDSYNM